MKSPNGPVNENRAITAIIGLDKGIMISIKILIMIIILMMIILLI